MGLSTRTLLDVRAVPDAGFSILLMVRADTWVRCPERRRGEGAGGGVDGTLHACTQSAATLELICPISSGFLSFGIVAIPQPGLSNVPGKRCKQED